MKPTNQQNQSTNKTFFIKTLGCKVNQCESEAIRNTLEASGFTDGSEGDADVVIVNTCTVTGKAAMQSRQAVRRSIRANPGARVLVTGCHAQTAPDELAAIDGVHLVVGTRDKHRIPEKVLESINGKDAPDAPVVAVSDVTHATRFAPLPGVAHGSRTRPFLKIQDGCNAFCTYCIVPHARGRSRSLPVDQVLAQIQQLGQLGYREVVLTGIHIGCYGMDLAPATDLKQLLDRIRGNGHIERIRISSIEPRELTEPIIELASTEARCSGRLCAHFHIPLQSGDDDVLKRMHRPYDAGYFRQLVLRIVKRIPHAAIGVDTLIGFPGETDRSFETTYRLIQELPVAYLHVFPFSARKGTPAFSFSDPIPSEVIKARCSRMRQLGNRKRRDFYARHMGQTLTVLVEESRNKPDGRLKGFSDNYISIRFDGPDEWFNTFQEVKVSRVSDEGGPEGEAQC